MMASDILSRTQEVLSERVLELFSDSNDHTPCDDVIQAQLMRPLESIWQANEVYKVLQKNPTAANFCGKVFKNGEPAVFCK